LTEEIAKISKAYEESKTNLLTTGAFSEAEVKDNLSSIQQRIAEKQSAFDGYS